MGNFEPIPGLPGYFRVKGWLGVLVGVVGIIAFILCFYFWIVQPAQSQPQGFAAQAVSEEFPGATVSKLYEENNVAVFLVENGQVETYVVMYDITNSSYEEQDQPKNTTIITQKFTIDGAEVDINTKDDNVTIYQK